MESNDSPVMGSPSRNGSLIGILIGDELGQIKRIDVNSKNKVITVSNDAIEGIHPSKSVSSICCLENQFNNSIEFLIANKSNTLSLYNCVSNHLRNIKVGVNNESLLIGAQPIDDHNIVLCYQNGSVVVKNIEKDLIDSNQTKRKAIKLLGLDLYSNNSNQNTGNTNSSNGKDMSCHKPCPKPSKYVNIESSVISSSTSIYSPNYNTLNTCLTSFKVCNHMLAISGKNVDLKVFDLNTKQNIFTAKSAPHDWLGLKQQVWISGVDWVGGNSSNNSYPSMVATCSRSDPCVRIYDIKSKSRKPVMNISLKDQTFNNDSNPPSLTSICSTSVPHSIAIPTQNLIVGTTIGRMLAIDLRFNSHSYRHLGVFKGFGGGAIRDIKYVSQTHNSHKILSCSLDRFVRIHNFNTSASSKRSLESKFYLKTRPTCLHPICSSFVFDTTISNNEDSDISIE